jgi:secondary thiamine-phosphate synthase enzyme
MRQLTHQIVIAPRGRGFYEFTREAARLVGASGLQTGLATFFVQHTSASLLIQENADPEVRHDLERFFSRLVPEGERLWRHIEEGEDDMPAHVRAALTATHLSIPVVHGAMTLGTWQGIYLWEHRLRPHERRIAVHIFGE